MYRESFLRARLTSPSTGRRVQRGGALRLSPWSARSWATLGVSVMEAQLSDHERIPLYAIHHPMLIIYSA